MRQYDFLRTPADELAYRAARHLARQAGVTNEQFQAMVEAYGDGVRRGLSGPQLKAFIAELPQVMHLAPAMREKLDTAVYQPLIERGLDRVGELVPAPTAEANVDTVMRAEALMKSDPAKYWSDKALQEDLAEALERIGRVEASGGGAAPEPDGEAALQAFWADKVKGYETMMRERPGEYWKPNSPHQADYLKAIEQSTGAARGGDAVAAVALREDLSTSRNEWGGPADTGGGFATQSCAGGGQ